MRSLSLSISPHISPHTISVPILYQSPYYISPHTISVPILYQSPYYISPHTISVPILYQSPYYISPHTISVPILYQSPYYEHLIVKNGIQILEDYVSQLKLSNYNSSFIICGDLNAPTSSVFLRVTR